MALYAIKASTTQNFGIGNIIFLNLEMDGGSTKLSAVPLTLFRMKMQVRAEGGKKNEGFTGKGVFAAWEHLK